MAPSPVGPSLEQRAARHAALGDATRLAIVDALSRSDRAPVELAQILDLPSNLLAHHLDVLEAVGLITRSRSSGDGRRRYVHLGLDARSTSPGRDRSSERHSHGPALFVCTHNSARSQLAAALWRSSTGDPAESAGTHPRPTVHPEAVDAGRRAGLDLSDARPRHLTLDGDLPPLVITVCDRAHEELAAPTDWLHWSIPDPVPSGRPESFDRVVDELRTRIDRLTMAEAL